MPLGVQNIQPHNPAVLVNLNNVQQTDAANNELAAQNTHHGILNILIWKDFDKNISDLNVQTTTDGDRTSQIVIDNPTCKFDNYKFRYRCMKRII